MEIKIGKHQIPILIAEEDYNNIKQDGWCLSISSHGYVRAVRFLGKIDGKYKYENNYVHRLITKCRKDLQVDHINRNPLDNRRENLRVCKSGSNARNTDAVSGYKGVHYSKKNKNWVAQITKNYKCYHIGSFKTAEEGAKAYNKEAKKLHGKYARLNVIEE